MWKYINADRQRKRGGKIKAAEIMLMGNGHGRKKSQKRK